MSVRSRFAPSPTGYLHIGGARTALFSYLFARSKGGRFILRIEDTDRERSTPQSVQAILDGLAWLELEWDEGPFFQTERMDRYRAELDRLIASGLAYRCTCTADELERKRERAQAEGRRPGYDGTCRDRTHVPSPPYTIRFRGPRDGETRFHDLIKGDVVFQNSELDDMIVARSDGTPVYNFCVVVDDADMKVSHVIRGEDHVNNTPKQIQLYEALGYVVPQFAHVPLILGLDRARLSKRHGATSVIAYRDMGYFPEAMINYLVRLGWSHGDQEIFTREELIEKFRIEDVGQSAGVFNPEKLDWVNAQYMKTLPPERLVRDVKPFLAAKGVADRDDVWIAKMVATLRDRAQTLVELVDLAGYYLREEIELDPQAKAKFLKPEIAPVLRELRDGLAALEGWDVEPIKSAFEKVQASSGLALGKIAQPVRVAVTGGTASPGIFEVLDVLGRERTLARLDSAIAGVA